MTPTCEMCGAPIRWTVTAAYEADPSAVHPTFATYPMPMFRVCDVHLAAALHADASRPTAATPSTNTWLVRPWGLR